MKTKSKKFPFILQKVLDALGITAYRMAVDMGVATSKITQMLENGNPSHDFVDSLIATYPRLNPAFVVSGVGAVLIDSNAKPIGVMSDIEFVEVPFLSLKARASFISEYKESTQPVLENYPVMKTAVNGYKDCILFEVDGNSMFPTIANRAKCLCTKLDKTEWAYVSGVFAILYRDFFVIKRIKNNDLTSYNTLTLHSDNKEFGTVVIKGEDIRDIWKVVKIYEQSLE